MVALIVGGMKIAKLIITAAVIALISILTLSGCTAEDLDPTGNWNVLLTWTTGSCRMTGAQASSTSVAYDDAGNLVIAGTAGRDVAGSVICSEKQCHLSFDESGRAPEGGPLYSVTVHVDLVMNDAGEIMGSGQTLLAFVDGRMCNQDFIATGNLNFAVVSQ